MSLSWLPSFSLIAAGACLCLVIRAFALSGSWSGVANYGIQTLVLLAAVLGAEQRAKRALPLVSFRLLRVRIGFGALLLSFPSQFSASVYVYVRPYAQLWGLMFLTAGVMLGTRLLWRTAWTRYLTLSAAGAILFWTYEAFLRTNTLPAIVPNALLAGAVLVEAFVSPAVLKPAGRLQNKLIVLPVFLVGLALLLLVAGVLAQTDQAYMSRATQDLQSSAHLLADDTSSTIEAQTRFAKLESLQPAIRSMDPGQQRAAMLQSMAADPSITRLMIANAVGQPVLVSDLGQLPSPSTSTSQAPSPGPMRVVVTHQPVTEVLDSASLAIPILAVRVPIFSDAGSFAGVYSRVMRLSNLNDDIRTVPAGEGWRVIIVDATGRVVVHPDPSLVSSRADLSGLAPVAAALRGDDITRTYSDAGRLWLSAQADVPGTAWHVFVQQPQTVILAPAANARERALAFLAFMLFVVTVALVVTARSFSRPLIQLAGAAGRLGDGSYDGPLPAARSDEIGDLVTAFGSMRDRLKGQMELLRLQRDQTELERSRLDTVLSTVNLAIFTTDEDGRVTLLNPVGERLFGVKATDAAGRPYADLLRLGPEGSPALQRALSVGESVALAREEAHGPDGRPRVYAASTAPLRRGDGAISGALEAVLDLTEYAALQRELQSRTEALEAKTAEQDAFLYTVSHDLKAPLVSIEGMAQLLSAEAGSRLLESDTFYVSRIVANVQRLSALLEDLLSLSRIGRTETAVEAVSLGAVVEDVRQDLASQLGTREARLIVETPLPAVQGNRGRLAELLTNLVDNAIKYTPPERRPEIHIGAAIDGKFADCWVQDNGVGIAEEQRLRVFELFQRLPDGKRLHADGSGAGLAIVARIVPGVWRACLGRGPSGGRNGNSFHPAAGRYPRRKKEIGTMEMKPLRILLVEDNPDHAFISRRALEQAHRDDGVVYHLDHVEDGQSALDYLYGRGEYQSTPSPDLVLLDLQLPVRSGLEVLKEIKTEAHLRRIPVVMLTTSEAQKDIIDSYDLHANEYVTKPVNAMEYLEKVRAIPAYWTHVSDLPPPAARL